MSELTVKHFKNCAGPVALVAILLTAHLASAQILAVPNGQSLTVKVTTTPQAVTASRSDLLATARKLVPSLQKAYPMPITQLVFVNPKDGSVIATFARSEWQ